MISTNEVYIDCQALAQKSGHGTIPPSDFNQYATLASMDLFNERLGSARDYYKLGKGMPKTTSGMTKLIDESLRPFLVADQSVTVTAGVAPVPSNCEFIDSVMYQTVEVKWIPKNKEGNYINSSIDAPTVDYPVYIDLATDLKVLPASITPILLTFYKTPASIVWNYNLVSGRPVYNATGTVDFEWNPTEKLQLIMRILGYMGISIRDTELLQYSANEENTIA